MIAPEKRLHPTAPFPYTHFVLLTDKRQIVVYKMRSNLQMSVMQTMCSGTSKEPPQMHTRSGTNRTATERLSRAVRHWKQTGEELGKGGEGEWDGQEKIFSNMQHTAEPPIVQVTSRPDD